MVSSVRIRISPLLFCRSLQEKRRDLVEFRLWIGTPYTNDYTNALGQKYVQPIGDLSLHIRQHVRVEVEGHVYPGGAEHLPDTLGCSRPESMRVAKLWRSAWNGMSGKPARRSERKAKIIAAEGEYQASERLGQAADRLACPTALQLRLFLTLSEIASEKNSTIILPAPIALFEPYLSKAHSDNTSSTHSVLGLPNRRGSGSGRKRRP
jgi:hypothetical protein